MFLRHHYDFRHRGWHATASVPTGDVTAPTITVGPAVSAITDTTASVSWTLSEAGTGQVGYGLADPSSESSGNVTVVSSDLRTGTSQYVTIPKSALTFAADDVIVILLGKTRVASLFSQVAPTAGWTFHGNETYIVDVDQQMALAVKRITTPGSEPTNWEFDRGVGSQPDWSSIALVLRGVDLDMADAAIDVQEGVDDATPDAPDITTASANAFVITGHYSATNGADRSATRTAGAPSGFTLLGAAARLRSYAALAYREEAAAGAKSYGPWTHSPDNAVDDYQVFTIAFKAAAGGSVAGARAIDYDSQSTLEQNLLTSHSQSLSGLAPSTTHHYLVESADAAGNVVTSADATFVTEEAGGGGTPGGFPTSQTGVVYVAYGGSLAEPGYLVEVADPNFEGSITRISSTQPRRNQYARQPAWNADGTRAVFMGYGNRLLDGNTYADLGALAGLPSSRFTWSMTDPSFGWCTVGGNNRLYKYFPNQGTSQVVATFGAYSVVDHGRGEGRPDMNDRYVALLGGTTSLFMYDAVADSVVGTTTLPNTTDWIGTSCTGQYMVVRFASGGTGSGQGVWAYTRTGQPVRNLTPGGHGDVALNAAGEDVYVGIKSGGIKSTRMSDGQTLDVAFGNYPNGHVSGCAVRRPGWAYLSNHVIYGTNSPGLDQIIAAKLDGSLETQVWCHARTIQTPAQYDYDASTHAVPNIDGTKVMWGGGWERSTTGNSNLRSYVVRIAP
jgi:hypothetical protein